MDDLTTTINRALRARGCSAHQASLEAGSPELIRNIRRGRMPSVERLQVLCEVLELEFYIGPAREAGAIDERRLREAVTNTERTLGARGIALEPEAKADAIAAIYDLLDRERAPGDRRAGRAAHRSARAHRIARACRGAAGARPRPLRVVPLAWTLSSSPESGSSFRTSNPRSGAGSTYSPRRPCSCFTTSSSSRSSGPTRTSSSSKWVRFGRRQWSGLRYALGYPRRIVHREGHILTHELGKTPSTYCCARLIVGHSKSPLPPLMSAIQ